MKQICFGLRLQNVSQGLRLIWDSLRTPTGNINGDQIIFSCLLTESNCNFCNVQSHKVLLYQKPEHRVTLTLTIHLLNIKPPMFLMAPLETSKPRRFIRTYMALCERCATVLNIMAFPFSQFTEQQVPSYAPYVIDRFELKKVFCWNGSQTAFQSRFRRCLDLYLCPRVEKHRISVHPSDILPPLPNPKVISVEVDSWPLAYAWDDRN